MSGSGNKKKKQSFLRGVKAESYACAILRFKGYKIIEQRYKCREGEIDIIARKKDTIAFIEVKHRRSADDALRSLTPRMRRRIVNAARHFLAAHPEYADKSLRFDLVAVGFPFSFQHLDNAWRPEA